MFSFNKNKLLLICGIISIIIAYSSIIFSIIISDWFSWKNNALSDLGAREPSAIIFNTGLILSGFFLILFSLSLYNFFKGLLSKIGIFLFLLTAISLSLIGIFPETAGKIHLYVSIMFFAFSPLSFIFLGISSILLKMKKYGFFTIIIAILMIITWLIPWKSIGVYGVAIPEFISSIFASIWAINTILKFYKK
ncbi:MAG: DUF998 domain-containing protein [Nitrososphaerota archaeon]